MNNVVIVGVACFNAGAFVSYRVTCWLWKRKFESFKLDQIESAFTPKKPPEFVFDELTQTMKKVGWTKPDGGTVTVTMVGGGGGGGSCSSTQHPSSGVSKSKP